MTRLRRHEFTRLSLFKLFLIVALAPLLLSLSCRNYDRVLFRYQFRQAVAEYSRNQFELSYDHLNSSRSHAGPYQDQAGALGFCLALQKQSYAEASSLLNNIEQDDLRTELSYYLFCLSPSHRAALPFSSIKSLASRSAGGSLVAALECVRLHRRGEAREYLSRLAQIPLLPLPLLVSSCDLIGKIEYHQKNYARAEASLASAHGSLPRLAALFVNWESSLAANQLSLGLSPASLPGACQRLADHLSRRASLLEKYRFPTNSTGLLETSQAIVRNALGYLSYLKGEEGLAREMFSLPSGGSSAAPVAGLNLSQLDLRTLLSPTLPPGDYEGREVLCLSRFSPEPTPEAWISKLPPLSGADQGALLNNVGVLLYRRAAKGRSGDLAEQAVRYLAQAEFLSENRELTLRNKEEAGILLRKLRLAKP